MKVVIIDHTTGTEQMEDFASGWEATYYVEKLNEDAGENRFSWESRRRYLRR